jgi:AcrR family transcriptional regulator
MKAAKALFAKEGFHATNTKRIAAKAGVAVGSVYAYFPDKKALFLAVLEEHNQIIAERIALVRPDPAGLVDKESSLEILINEIVQAHTLSPSFHRQAMLLRETDPDVGRAMDEQEKEQREIARQYLASWGDHVKAKDLEAAAFVIFGAIESVAHSLALAETDLDSKRLTRELSTMISRYLFPEKS